METDYGISQYIGDRSISIPCVLKELYTDFVVQEILADQTVLRIATPTEIFAGMKEEEDKGVDSQVDVPSHIKPDDLARIDAMSSNSRPITISIEGLSKDERKGMHDFIRRRYQGKLSSETKLNLFEISYCGVNSKCRKRKRWSTQNPDNCHFTMAKENKDTSYALGVIAKFLNIPVTYFRTHGIKDRRAVTAQRVSCNRIEKERIMSLNSRLRDILVYDFVYKDEEVKIGGHWGNRFSIVLRNIPTNKQTLLEDRMREWMTHGFINYFGTQRFGSCDTNTAIVGKLILQRKWESAVRLILSNEHMPGYLGTVGNAVRCWNETGNAQQALRQLKGSQAYASIEATIFKCLSKGGTWQKLNTLFIQCITESLPRNLRSLYVHAYQSLLWNIIVSRRISERGIVVCSDDLGSDGRPLPSSASLFDIYVPLPGDNSFYSNYAADWYTEILSGDLLTNNSFSSLEDRFALGESIRPMLICPGNVQWQFIQYSDPKSYLQDGIATRSISEEDMKGERLALKVQFNLPAGAYATVALRQITGTDMSKKSMKIQLTYIKAMCCEEVQDIDYQTNPDNPSVKCDCLEPSSTVSKPDNQSEFNTSLEHNIKYYEENITSFKNRIVRTLQDFMVDSGYSNNCLQSWNSPVSIGVELQFEKLSRGNLPIISILVTILIYPSPSAVINVSKIIDNSRHFLPSFSIYQSNINDSVANGMGKALTSSEILDLKRYLWGKVLVGYSKLFMWKNMLKHNENNERSELQGYYFFNLRYLGSIAPALLLYFLKFQPSGIFINGPFPYSPGTYPQPTSPFSSPFQPIPNPFRPLSPTCRLRRFSLYKFTSDYLSFSDPLNPFHPSRELLPSRPERPSGPRIFPPNRWDDNII
uniref:TRUD domain-containing protein n=1 Tax=Heterorhabditis bacteriophora TaxID=37862 RepID=A0A1I7XSY4_HETBA